MAVAKYALFAWTPHDASGGFSDLKGGIGTLDQCMSVFEDAMKAAQGDLAGHIVDMTTLKIVFEPDVVFDGPVPTVEWASYPGPR